MYYYIINIEGGTWLYNRHVRVFSRGAAKKFGTAYRAKAYFKKSGFKDLPFTIEEIPNTNITDPYFEP